MKCAMYCHMGSLRILNKQKNNKSIWDFFKRKKSLDLIEWLCMGMCEVHHVLSHGFPEEFQTKKLQRLFWISLNFDQRKKSPDLIE